MNHKKINFVSDKSIKFIIGLSTAVIITVLFPNYETIEADYSVGMIWGKEDLIAPFSFPIYKSESVYLRELEEAKKNVFPVFDLNYSKYSGQINWLDSLNNFFVQFKKTIDYENEFSREMSFPEEKRTTSDQTLKSLKSEMSVQFNQNEWDILIELYNNPGSVGSNSETFKKRIVLSLNQINEKKIIDIPKSQFKSNKISFVRNKVEEVTDISEVYDTYDVNQLLESSFKNYFKTTELTGVALKIARKFVFPDFVYNKDETEKVIKAVTESIPKTIGLVKENERIVSKHEPINEGTRLRLESYKRVRSEQMGSRDFYEQQLGRFSFVSILILLIGIFLYKMRPLVYENNTKLILISTIILLQCLFSYLSLNVKIDYPVEYLIFVPVAAMLLTIIFDSRVSFYTVIIICILISAIRGGDYDILIPNFCASILVIYSVRDIKKRSQIFVSMFYILIGYFVAIVSIALERFETFPVIKNQLYMAALNSVLSPILAYGLLIFYEKVFRIATDLVFLELTDFNHPLLRELSSKAPGTFHHSIVMGNLSEQAAKEIRANQILTRVGCYYHDIGKIIKPEYFVENQLESKNKHERLNPSVSAKVIISHVKNG
ncbi:MAG: HDIG domain-containing metalloprotein, partial [Ignavibacteria bacterium]